MPDVSVILTVYNGARFIREAVDSILQQSFRDFELVIVDNASTDETPSLLRSCADPRIRLLAQSTNLGQTRALNLAVREARGIWLARMDADDMALPERLAVQWDYVQSRPSVGAVGSWHQEVDETGHPLKIMRYPTDPVEIAVHLMADGNLTRRCLSHPTVMLRKAAVLAVGGYDETYRLAQDYDLWTRLSPAWEIHNVGKVLMRYRVNAQSGSKRNAGAMEEELDRIAIAHIRRIWPTLADAEVSVLADMLRNRSCAPRTGTGRSVFQIFDEFFARRYGERGQTKEYQRWRERIKTYYLPRLWGGRTDEGLAQMGHAVCCDPGAWIDTKFMKNVAKRVLQ